MSALGGSERVQRLAATPSSAGAARRAVTGVLEAWGHEDLTETAQLLVSEVVTNALLHAGTEIEVRTTAAASGVRIAVHDGSSLAPTRRHYGEEAATGRGLGLVESLASAWGIEATGSGKAVWFELGKVSHPVDRANKPPADPTAGPTKAVYLFGLPPALVHATLQYGDAVLRELVLLSVSGDLGDDVSPVYVTPEVDLAEILVAVEVALADGQPAVDVEVALPLSHAEPALERLALVDEADRLAREGRLLAAPAVPEIGACRRWLLGQIAVQLRGDEPSAWQLPSLPEPAVPRRPLTEDEVRPLSPTGVAVMVADTANRIVFVSDEAALLLGWDAGGLIGRRLTTVIPPDLREAHLAGFTRLQVTGESRLLGCAVGVRALRQDGSEVDVELEIDRVEFRGERGFRAVLRS